ncbi:hypothetical protein GYH30_047591 [Glycine max]|nr:hypothetical protein GYH30_047591 [Glycine max]
MWRSHRANDEEECGGDDDGRDASIDRQITHSVDSDSKANMAEYDE